MRRDRDPRKRNDKQAPEMQDPGTRREEAIGTSAPELTRIPHPPVHGGWTAPLPPPAGPSSDSVLQLLTATASNLSFINKTQSCVDNFLKL